MPPRQSRRLADLISTHNRLIPVLENTGPGSTVNIGKDDLKPEVLSRMVQYAVDNTTENTNDYPLSQVQGKTQLSDPTGNPAGLGDPGMNDQAHHSAKFATPGADGQSAEAQFNTLSDSGFLDTDQNHGGQFRIKKGKNASDDPTGTQIYQEVSSQGEQSGFVRRVRQVQFDNNRFTLGKTFVPRTGLEGADGISVHTPGSDGSASVAEDESNLGVGYAQQEFGKHGPRKFPTSQNETATLVKLKDLKKIGLLAMLQASGEYYIPTDPNSVAQQLAARGASLAPGLARIGQKIGMNRVNPVKIMKDVNPSYTKPTLDDNIKRNEVLSYGNVNNWMTPFAGLNSTASIASAALLTLTISQLLKRAAQLLKSRVPAGTPPQFEPNPSTADRRKRLGSYLGKSLETTGFASDVFELDLVQTNFDYVQCVSRGIDIFFGLNSIGTQSQKVVNNHGYYNTVLRSLIRGTTDFIMSAAGGIVNTSGVTNVNDVGFLGNPMGGLELVQKLNSSQLLRFCNIMATMGDVALAHEADGFIMNENGEVDEVISDIDRIVVEADVGPNKENALNPSILQSVDRLPQQYRNALAWGSNTIKSMYMFPDSIYRAEGAYLGARDQTGSPTETAVADLSGMNRVRGPMDLVGPRISAEEVKSMEEYLEADYMPFYFHDLRTNEIIAFHAFLEDMSDSFDPEYTEVEGYGRIGSVPIYKNTKRNISIGFRVVATNPKDFDHMWWKINKLITMVYPQYTEGRQVGTDTNKFIQPFSQVPSASPLVRLRLGDVFKSNYSKFNISRLFGLGSGNFALEGQDGTYRYNANLVRSREQVAARMGRGDFNPGETAMLIPLPPVRGRGASQRLRGYPRRAETTDTTQGGQPGSRPRPNAPQFGFLTLAEKGSPLQARSNGAPLEVSQLIRVRITQKIPRDNVFAYHFTVINPAQGQDGIYACGQYNLQPDPDEIIRISQNQNTSTDSNTSTNTPDVVKSFFSSTGNDGNPIIKAFESTQGKGLAGFIKGLKFDWSDSRWETGRHNSRAPMSLKINFDFNPIHDINPGLDSSGFMTAPVYNVGDTVKSFAATPEDKQKNSNDAENINRAFLASRPRSSNGSTNGGT